MNPVQLRVLFHDAFTGLAAGLIALAFLVGVFIPGQSRRNLAEAELGAALRAMQDVPRRAGDVERLRQEVAAVEQYLDEYRPVLSGQAKTSEVIDTIAAVARSSGLTISRLEPHTSNLYGPYVQLPVELVCDGDYRATAEFLRGLETGPALVVVHEVSLTLSAEPDAGPIRSRIRLSIYAGPERSSDSAGFDDSRHRLAADH